MSVCSISARLIVLLSLGLASAAPSFSALPEERVSGVVKEVRRDPYPAVVTLRDAVEMRLAICCATTTSESRLSRSDVALRLRALAATSEFAHLTAAGLTRAANDPIAQLRMTEAFGMELAAIDRRIQESMFDLLAQSAVEAKGWFVTSIFGGEVETLAATLIRRADVRADALEALARRITELAARREASPATVLRINAILAGQKVPNVDLAAAR